MSDSPSKMEPTPSANRRRRRWLRILVLTGFVLLILVMLLIGLLPTLLSTGPGTRWVLSMVNGRVAGSVLVQRLDLGWFSGQAVGGLEIRDPEGKPVVVAERIDLPEASLVQLVRGDYNLGTVKLVKPVVTLVQDEHGELNLGRALAARAPKAPAAPTAAEPSPLAQLSVNVIIENGAVTYAAPAAKLVTVTLARLDAKVPNLQAIMVDIDAQVTSEENTGGVKGKVQLNDFFDNQLGVNLDQGKVDADLSLTHLPMAALDRFTRQEGRLSAIFGNILDASVKAKGNRALLDATVAAKSNTLTLNATSQIRENTLSRLDAKVQFSNVPLAPVDQMLHQGGKLTALLGTRLASAEITASGNLANMDATIKVRTENLDANVIGQLRDRMIIVPPATTQQGQRVKLTVSPGAFAALTEEPGRVGSVKLAAPFDVTVALNALQLKLSPDNEPDFSTLVADLGLTLGQIALDAGGDIGRVTLDSKPGVITYNRSGQKNRLTAVFESTAQYQNRSGVLAANVSVDDLLTATGQVNRTGVHGTATVSVNNWPTAVVDSLARSGVVCRNAIGPTLDELKMVATIGPGAGASANSLNGDVVVSIRSAHLNGSIAGVVANDRFTARAPAGRSAAGFDWDVQEALVPALVRQYASGNETLGKLALSKAARVSVALDKLVIPVSGDISKGVDIKARVSSKELAFKGIPGIDEGGLRDLAVSVGAVIADNVLTVDPASKITFAVVPATGATAATKPVRLAQPANVELDLTRFTMDLRGEGWRKARVAAKLSVDKIATAGDPRLASAALSPLVITIPESALDQTVSVNITRGDLLYGNEKGTLGGQIQLTGLGSGHPRYNARLDVDKLPVALVDGFNPGTLKWADLLGPVIDKISVAAVPSEKNPDELAFSAKVTSKALNSEVSGRYQSGVIAAVNKASYAQLELDPKGFAAIKAWLASAPTTPPAATRPVGRLPSPAATVANGADDTVLARTATLRCEVEDLGIQFLPPSAGGGLDPAKSHLAVHFSLPNGIAWHSASRKEDAQISKLIFDVTSSALADRIDVSAAATTTYQAAGAAPLSGPIKIANTSISRLFDPKTGKVDTRSMTVTTDASAAALPVGVMDALAGQNGRLLNVLGPVMENLSVKGQYRPGASTTFDVAFKTTNTSAALPLSISKDLVLTLRADPSAGPATAQITKVTPELAKTLSLAHPYLGQVSGNRQPISLTFDKGSFRVPLSPFTSAEASVRNGALKGVTCDATLNLGTLEMAHGSLTQSLSQLTTLLSAGSMERTFHAAFNPLEVHIASGLVRTNDLWLSSYDLLPGRYAGLGVKVQAADLGTDPIEGELAVALPGLMVRQIPGLEKYVTPNYIFAVTKKGPLATMQIDWGGFIADFTKMTARVEAANQAERFARNNPLAALAVQTAVNAVMDAIPQGSKQGDTRRTWPNLPQQLPTSQPAGTAPVR